MSNFLKYCPVPWRAATLSYAGIRGESWNPDWKNDLRQQTGFRPRQMGFIALSFGYRHPCGVHLWGGCCFSFSRQDECRRPPKIPRGFCPSTPGRPSGRHISGVHDKSGCPGGGSV